MRNMLPNDNFQSTNKKTWRFNDDRDRCIFSTSVWVSLKNTFFRRLIKARNARFAVAISFMSDWSKYNISN